MKKIGAQTYYFVFCLAMACSSLLSAQVLAPKPVLPIPNADQLAWQKLETYAFVHFSMNTFSDREWGYGDEKPQLFNPEALDCRQWAKTFKESGLKAVILTAKHHDGFCLWPSKYTEHSVKNSPFRGGKGDVVKELSDACKEFGLKFGIYYSPWDRNHKEYSNPEYIEYMRNQLTELLTNYGEIFEVWFDGANGGDGYYGGANTVRKVDKRSYYDWPVTYALVRKLQPHALMFSDGGPDIRWVGNESGYAYDTTWSNLDLRSVYAGMEGYERFANGQEHGTHWVPAEVDVSIRPGWYYHESEDAKVKSLTKLTQIYYESVGLNSNLLINFPVDRRGLIHEQDVKQISQLAQKIKEDFKENLSAKATIKANAERGSDFAAAKAIDSDFDSYWTLADSSTMAELTLKFQEPVLFNRIMIQEYIPMGQRVKAFGVEVKTNNGWKQVARGGTIGYKRLLRLDDQRTDEIKIRLDNFKDIPLINNIEVYFAPKLLLPPQIGRDKSGVVSISNGDLGLINYYTLDGSQPDKSKIAYTKPFKLAKKATIRAVAYDKTGAKYSEISTQDFDIAKAEWKILGEEAAQKFVDANPDSWGFAPEKSIVLDLGKEQSVSGFSYLPSATQGIKKLAVYTSRDGSSWQKAFEGEMDNIKNNPKEQKGRFAARKARFVRFEALEILGGALKPGIAEVGVFTE